MGGAHIGSHRYRHNYGTLLRQRKWGISTYSSNSLKWPYLTLPPSGEPPMWQCSRESPVSGSCNAIAGGSRVPPSLGRGAELQSTRCAGWTALPLLASFEVLPLQFARRRTAADVSSITVDWSHGISSPIAVKGPGRGSRWFTFG